MAPLKSRFDPDYVILLRQIQSARKASGMSQAEIAEKMGLTQSTWSKIETGERRIDLIELRRFCRALSLDFVSFVRAAHEDMS